MTVQTSEAVEMAADARRQQCQRKRDFLRNQPTTEVIQWTGQQI